MSKLICLDCVNSSFHYYLGATLTFMPVLYGLLNYLRELLTSRTETPLQMNLKKFFCSYMLLFSEGNYVP